MRAEQSRWAVPTQGTAFLFDLESIARQGELWRQLDRAVIEALVAAGAPAQSQAGARFALWGGLQHGGSTLLLLLAEIGPGHAFVKDLYEALRPRLPEGGIIFAGAPLQLPELWPLYAVAEGQVLRCAVSAGAAPPALRVLSKQARGASFVAVSPAPIHLAALVDKMEGVGVLVTELERPSRGERLNEEGDRVDSQGDSADPPTVMHPPDEPPKGMLPSPKPFEALDGPASPMPFVAAPVIAREGALVAPAQAPRYTPSGSLLVADADVIAVQELVPSAALPPLPEEVSLPMPSDGQGARAALLARLGGASSERTLVDIGDEDIAAEVLTGAEAAPGLTSTEKMAPLPEEPEIVAAFALQAPARAISSPGMAAVTPLAALKDGQLRLILTAAPLRESCDRLAEVLERAPAEIARIFALASGALPTTEAEMAFALRVRATARAVGWVLVPGE